MSDPPGKLLSSLNPCSEKRTSKLGGCAGVFFQLFDWNRRLNGKRFLSRKRLPAERPAKHGTRGLRDDKLPMAKLLLIANENRGGFPKVPSTQTEGAANKEKTPEKKKKKSKRSPSVVAKLMGLETMPSPEPCKDRKQATCENSDPKIDGNTAPGKTKSTSRTKTDSKNSLDAAGKPQQTLICYKSDEPRISFFYKLPALSPRKSESALRSILSPSKTHNKLLSPIKSPLATKRGARLLEAAAKILEPNMQPSARPRGINSNAIGRPLLGGKTNEDQKNSENALCKQSKRRPILSTDSKKQQQQSVALRVYSDQPKNQGNKPSKQDKKTTNVLESNTLGKSQSSSVNNKRGFNHGLRRSGSTREESASHVGNTAGQPQLMRSRSVREETEQVKSMPGCNNERRNMKEEKTKVEFARQKQSSNRLSQPRTGLGKKDLDSKDEHMQDIENQDPNVLNHHGNNGQTLSNESAPTNTSGSILSYGKLFSSRKSGRNLEPTRKMQKKGDSLGMKSRLRKKGVSMDATTKDCSNTAMGDSAQESKTSTVNEVAFSNSLTAESCLTLSEDAYDNKSLEVESSLVTSIDSVDLFSKDHKHESGSSLKVSRCGSQDSESVQISNEAVTCMSDYTMDSDVTSFRVSVEDEPSSTREFCDSSSPAYAHLELPSHKKKKAVSYSGKSTAAILQELLTALNSAKTKITFNNDFQHVPSSSDCESSSKFELHLDTKDCSDSVCSSAASNDDLKKTPLPSKRHTNSKDDWRNPSPVSILEFPCEDNSSCSDGMDSAQDQGSNSKLHPMKHFEVSSKRHCISSDLMGACGEPFESEEQYIRAVVRSAKLTPASIYSAKLRLPFSLLDHATFDRFERQFYQQWEWGIMPDEQIYANCRSETDMDLTRSLYSEAATYNRKLVFECVDEAFNMHFGINEHHSRQSPWQTQPHLNDWHISESVCRQMESWREMACGMNIDDMVEQEMSTGLGKWMEFVDEVSDIAVETERYIVQGLISELVIDMSRSLP
ncbi:hypothetical protein KP509_33G017800 [Ceratopteris richardii]|uniref:DUF4378 domain-containing protein n=1 Tax=Ceratopteris richardii TaxID=49495 RepID=A0A8T2QNU1_CERRI|nr:hypothetical protein KP509_33G017800 [Ceratopteris richardii]